MRRESKGGDKTFLTLEICDNEHRSRSQGDKLTYFSTNELRDFSSQGVFSVSVCRMDCLRE